MTRAGRKRKLTKKTVERKTAMTLKHKLTKSGSATSLKLTEALIKLQELELQATENRFKVHSIHDNIAQVMSDYNKVKVMGLNDKELSEAEMNMRGRVENMFDTFDDRNKMGQVTLESVKEGLINTQADEQADPKNAKKKQRQNSGTEDPDDALAEFASEAKKAAAVKKRIEDRLVESQDHLQKAIQEEENARREVAQLMIKLTNAKAEIRRVWEESQEKLEELKKLKTRNNYLEQQGKRFEQTIKKLKESHAQSSKQLEEELKVMETARRNLRDKLDQVDMITNQLENEKDAALKKVGEVEAKLKAAEDEQSQREASIKAEQKALKKQIAALQTQLSTSEAETTSLREQLFNAKRDMEEQLAIAKVKAKEKAEKAVAEKVKEHEATIASLNAEWQAKVDEGIARRKELLAEAEDKLANEIEKGKKLEEDANARAEEARKAAEAEMKKAAEQYEQQIEETKKSLDDVSEKLGDTEALLAKTEQEKSKITNQLDDVNKKYDTLEIEHRETVESLENIKASNADAQKEFTEKIQSLEGTVEKLHNTLENKTNEYESKIAAVNKNLTKAQQDLEESSAAGNAQNEELAKLQKALELERVEMEATKESLTSQLGSSDELMETLKSEHANDIARLTSNFELQLHEKDESVAKAMEKMNDDVSNTNTKVLEFEATIDGLQPPKGPQDGSPSRMMHIFKPKVLQRAAEHTTDMMTRSSLLNIINEELRTNGLTRTPEQSMALQDLLVASENGIGKRRVRLSGSERNLTRVKTEFREDQKRIENERRAIRSKQQAKTREKLQKRKTLRQYRIVPFFFRCCAWFIIAIPCFLFLYFRVRLLFRYLQ